MKKNEYQGKYRIDKSPDRKRLKEHNAKSWTKVEKFILRSGGNAEFEALSIAVKDHESGSANAPHPYQFIIYCIKNSWLERV